MFIVLLYCYCILKLIFFSILEWTSNYLSSKRADSCLQFSQPTIEFLFKLSDIHVSQDQHLYQKDEASSVEAEYNYV